MDQPNTTRSISTIAADIRKNWPKPFFGAFPYIEAMSQLDKITDNYGADRGVDIVAYFLSNAANWRGEDAKRIKAELKKMSGRK